MSGGITRTEVRMIAGLILAVAAGVGVGRFWGPPAPGGTPGAVNVIRATPTPSVATTQTPAPPTPTAAPPSIAPEFLAAAPTPASSPAPTAPPPEVPPVPGTLDLNKASKAELELLPGIGPAKADAILALRAERGAFRSVDELDDVSGIGPKTLERLRPFLSIGGVPASGLSASSAPAPSQTNSAAPARVRINTATAAEIETLAGIGPKLAQRIVADRAANGPFRRLDDLTRVRGIGPTILASNRDRIAFD